MQRLNLITVPKSYSFIVVFVFSLILATFAQEESEIDHSDVTDGETVDTETIEKEMPEEKSEPEKSVQDNDGLPELDNVQNGPDGSAINETDNEKIPAPIVKTTPGVAPDSAECFGIMGQEASTSLIRIKSKLGEKKPIDLGGTDSINLCKAFGTFNPKLSLIYTLHPDAKNMYNGAITCRVFAYCGLAMVLTGGIVMISSTGKQAADLSRANSSSGSSGLALAVIGLCIEAPTAILSAVLRKKAAKIFNNKQKSLKRKGY